MTSPKRQAHERPGNAESTPYIPTELLRLILLRLPVKSLCRFKCVSALWNSVVSDPHFEELQFDSSGTSLLISAARYNSFTFVGTIRFPQQLNDGPVERQQPGPFVLKTHPKGQFSKPRAQSVGGLMLVRFNASTLRIYNPSTGELSGDIHVPDYMDSCVFGNVLGYDPIDRAHKILGMRHGLESPDEERLGVVKTRYRVLTLDKQMKWRSLQLPDGDRNATTLMLASIGSVCFNGVVYYIGLQTTDSSGVCFVGFDVRSEVLRWVGLPPGIIFLRLTGFNGRAAIYDPKHLNNDSNDEIILWTFQGFDEQRDPWRCITIPKPPQWKHVIGDQKVTMEGTAPSGELLFKNSVRSSVPSVTLYFFNIGRKIIRAVDVLPHPAETKLFLLTSHVESIRSLKHISSMPLPN